MIFTARLDITAKHSRSVGKSRRQKRALLNRTATFAHRPVICGTSQNKYRQAAVFF